MENINSMASPPIEAPIVTPIEAPIVTPIEAPIQTNENDNFLKKNSLSNVVIFVCALAATYYISGIFYYRSLIKNNISIKDLQNQIDQLKN